MNIIKAPNRIGDSPRPWLFLAGSIEMGAAINWQDRVASAFADLPGTVLNPRRDDWDATWVQSKDNEQFWRQVKWELRAQETADLVLIHFEPDTKSPITLLELGIACRRMHNYCIVHCPVGFWRKGNVDIACEHYSVKQVETIDELISAAKTHLTAGIIGGNPVA